MYREAVQIMEFDKQMSRGALNREGRKRKGEQSVKLASSGWWSVA